jgi:hypothetical protein
MATIAIVIGSSQGSAAVTADHPLDLWAQPFFIIGVILAIAGSLVMIAAAAIVVLGTIRTASRDFAEYCLDVALGPPDVDVSDYPAATANVPLIVRNKNQDEAIEFRVERFSISSTVDRITATAPTEPVDFFQPVGPSGEEGFAVPHPLKIVFQPSAPVDLEWEVTYGLIEGRERYIRRWTASVELTLDPTTSDGHLSGKTQSYYLPVRVPRRRWKRRITDAEVERARRARRIGTSAQEAPEK